MELLRFTQVPEAVFIWDRPVTAPRRDPCPVFFAMVPPSRPSYPLVGTLGCMDFGAEVGRADSRAGTLGCEETVGPGAGSPPV